MKINNNRKYSIDIEVQFGPLEIIDLPKLIEQSTKKWQNIKSSGSVDADFENALNQIKRIVEGYKFRGGDVRSSLADIIKTLFSYEEIFKKV